MPLARQNQEKMLKTQEEMNKVLMNIYIQLTSLNTNLTLLVGAIERKK